MFFDTLKKPSCIAGRLFYTNNIRLPIGSLILFFILYVNDSKGTNPDSTFQAIYAYDRPMVLILGGRNKGSDLVPLMKLVQERVKQTVFYGEAALEFKQAADLIGYANYKMADNFDHAVELSQQLAEKGDVVVLSPACASWDSFPCFEARGERFKELVR